MGLLPSFFICDPYALIKFPSGNLCLLHKFI